MKLDKLFILCIEQTKSLKKYMTTSYLNQYKIDTTIFMNSENTKTYDPHRLVLNLKDKIDLKKIDKCIALSNLSFYYTWKI